MSKSKSINSPETAENIPNGVRFAPSPTGRFHLGNLRTAWISREWARALGEPWIVRFEDIDGPRVLAGARERQLADMAALGLVPDREYLQSARRDRHADLFARAVAAGAVYPCVCSRKEIQEALAGLASAPHGSASAPLDAGPLYAGTCRDRAERGRNAAGVAVPAKLDSVAWRFRSADPSGARDFIVARTDARALAGLPAGAAAAADGAVTVDGAGVMAATDALPGFVPAYHWACAIDDFDGGYRLLVRAWDLASSTPLQRAIQAWVARIEGVAGHVPPAVFHTALVTQDDGHRLEKRTKGVTLDELRARGWGSERILDAFRASYVREIGLLTAAAASFQPGEIFGESRREIRLLQIMGEGVPGESVPK